MSDDNNPAECLHCSWLDGRVYKVSPSCPTHGKPADAVEAAQRVVAAHVKPADDHTGCCGPECSGDVAKPADDAVERLFAIYDQRQFPWNAHRIRQFGTDCASDALRDASEGRELCRLCCNKDMECDDPLHRFRKDCTVCNGTGRATAKAMKEHLATRIAALEAKLEDKK